MIADIRIFVKQKKILDSRCDLWYNLKMKIKIKFNEAKSHVTV